MAELAANDSPPFSPTERTAILALLEDYSNALAIYHGTLEKPAKHDNDISIDCLPNDADELEMFSPEEIMQIEELKKRATSARIYENSLCMREIMEKLKEEIKTRGTFDVLTKEIEKIVSKEKEEEALLTKQESLRKTTRELQKLLEDEKTANEEKKKQMLNELVAEQRNVEEFKLIANAELKYLTEWGNAKCEQNSLRCDMEIQKLEKMLNDQRVRERNEQRVHAELTKFLMQETASLEVKSKELEERYIREKNMYKNEIRQLRIEIEARQKELDELKEEYHRNQEFIDTYLTEKEALRKEKERRERMQKSAIKIQAWWRGVMVRRKLGPYRPVEKRKRRQAKTKK